MLDFFGTQIVMKWEGLRIFIAIIGTAIATYYDIFNNRNVPNLLLYSFLGAALLVNLLFDTSSFGYTAVIAILVFIIGYGLYVFGQLGGADVFVLASISLLLPVQPTTLLIGEEPIIAFPFILSVLLLSSIVFGVFLLIRYVPLFMRGVFAGKVSVPKERFAYAGIILIAYVLFIYLSFSFPYFPAPYIFLFSVIVFLTLFFMFAREFIANEMIEWVGVKEIEEEDVIAIDRMRKGDVEKYKIARVATKNELEKLKKLPIEKYPVYKRMPVFLPFVLVGLIASVIFGDVVLLSAGLV